jgi:hypothetical protein
MATKPAYGEPGSRIPGSIYVREYCAICGDPIRVLPAVVGCEPQCSACEDWNRDKACQKATKNDISPWQENAIRALEET